MINHIISRKQTHLFFRHFLDCFRLFLNDNMNEERMQILFKQQKFSLRVLFGFFLIFCHFQSGVAYKSVAYKKACIVIGKAT